MADDNRDSAEIREDDNRLLDRKPYQSPKLQTFGQLSRVTQGSASVGNDGGSTMGKRAGGGMGGGGMGNQMN